MEFEEAQSILTSAEILYSAEQIDSAISRMAEELSAAFSKENPLILAVMGGAVVFAGQLLPRLHFPLEFDYLQLSRYGKKTVGGELVWRVKPEKSQLDQRVVIVLDDILDEGETMAAIAKEVCASGAKAFYSAVLTNKTIQKAKPITADFVGLDVPDRYVFGFGMDIRGAWRNLPAIYAMKESTC